VRDGAAVGRIAAIINRSHNAHYADRAGFFGFFACEDNDETAQALIDAASAHLRNAGCDVMRGPYNPTIHDDCGIQAGGNELPASVSMPWNPAYYPSLVERAGARVTRTLFAYHLPLHIGLPERVTKIAARLKKRSKNVHIRPFDMAHLDDELRLTHRLYNITLDRNGGFFPITLDDLLASADDLKAFAEPDFLIFAEVDGVPAGFMLTLPNFNEILHRTRGVPEWLRLPWILWLMKTHRIQTVRQVVLGVAPGHRDRGLAALLCQEMVLLTQRQAHSAELSWIESNNQEIITIIEVMGGIHNKTYQLYEKAL